MNPLEIYFLGAASVIRLRLVFIPRADELITQQVFDRLAKKLEGVSTRKAPPLEVHRGVQPGE